MRPHLETPTENPYASSALPVTSQVTVEEKMRRLARWALRFASASWGLLALQALSLLVALIIAVSVSRPLGAKAVLLVPALGCISVVTTLLSSWFVGKCLLAGQRDRETLLATALAIGHLGLLLLAALVLVAGAFAQ